MKIIQFGAGNIGRSFLGQLFARAGWDVAFVDVNKTMVDLLNERRHYTVVIKREGQADEVRRVGPVRAIDGRDGAAVAEELANADLVATSVGLGALPKVIPTIASGLALRESRSPGRPLDIIIAENARGADLLFSRTIAELLGPSYAMDTLVGLVETSIGKMVPIMRAEDLAADPLQVFAEAYESLIVDAVGFKGPIPQVSGLVPVKNIAAYVDRKLFVHNLGHAATAYLGYAQKSYTTLIPDALAIPGVEKSVRGVMAESCAALADEYPDAYTRKELDEHVEDLISRFKNRALGDTVHRVGRDLYRKLGREDRVVGAMLLCAKRGLPFPSIAAVYRAALQFKAPDAAGILFPEDTRFGSEALSKGVAAVLREVSGLDPSSVIDGAVITAILGDAGVGNQN